MKVCTLCKKNKEDDCFRIRAKNGYKYKNPTCKECDKLKASEDYYRKCNNPDFKAKNVSRVTEWRNKNKEKVTIRLREKRKTPEYKEYVKHYYQKNRDKIRAQHSLVCKRAASDLRDWYIVGSIVGKSKNPNRFVIKEASDLIELKRQYLILMRGLGKKRLYKKDYK